MKTFKITIQILLTLVVLFSCTSKTEKKETDHEVLAENAIELNANQYKMAGIQLGEIGRHSINNGIKVNGSINVTPQNIASVSAPLGGFIKNTSIVQGSAITKGETLAIIENFAFIEIQQGYLETKAKFQFAEIEYTRHNELFKENVYSEKNVQQSETEFKTLKAQMRGLEQKLIFLGIDPSKLTEDKITGALPVYAPISGYVRTVNMNIGKYVNPADVLCEIVNPENVVLELVVFEKDVQKVSAGQKVTFSTPNDPGKIYTATIYQAGKALDNDKTAMAYAKIEQTQGTLLSGMFVNAMINTSSDEVVAVPEESVVQFNEKAYIFIFNGTRQENGKTISDFTAIEVKKGTTDQGFTEITLPAGFDLLNVKVVVKGAYSVLSAWKNAGEMAC
jgi:cobalt-zinc-cadmium efflux system membrane fusion protein